MFKGLKLLSLIMVSLVGVIWLDFLLMKLLVSFYNESLFVAISVSLGAVVFNCGTALDIWKKSH